RSHGAVCGLDLKGIAARADAVEVDRFEHLAPKALEAPGQVAHAQPEHPTRIEGATLAHQAPQRAPVAHTAAGHVARAQGQIGAGTHSPQQAGEVGGIVREVAVHLHQKARLAIERVAEAGQVGGTDAALLAAMEHFQPIALARQAVGDLARAIGRAVIHDQHAKAIGRRAGEHLPRGSDDRLDVVALVVGREDQPRLAGHGSAYPSWAWRSVPALAAGGACGPSRPGPPSAGGAYPEGSWPRPSSRTPSSPTRSRSLETCTSSMARSCIGSSPTAPPPRGCVRPRSRW